MTDSNTTPATLSPVKRALAEIRRLRAQLAEVRSGPPEPLAVVGFAHRFPGVEPVSDALHPALLEGLDAISDVPPDRWDVEALFDPTRGTPNRMYTTRGGFLEDVRGFDPEFFGISPFEASSIDPQQRLLLEVAWEALEHAAVDPLALKESRTGVFVGIASNDYGRRSLADHANAYASVGSAFSVAAGRIAYLLDLRGPALSVDTACSSSLVATHLAAMSLRCGESDLALVGGVNLILAPEVTVDFCQAGMLAEDGICRTFDADASGYVRSEGCGVLVLKRLSDARREGDRVLATIRGSAVNQDGRSSGLTAPNGPAQEAVVRAALADAGLEPDDIDYVEAHGTGTTLGDPIEAQALGSVFGTPTRGRALLLGSAKTNVGHLEAAAGVAGLIKAVETLRHRRVPPHLHFRTPNPHIDWDALPLEIPTAPVSLHAEGRPIRAGVSSFGFSGTNAHIVLEAAPDPEPHPRGAATADEAVPPERSAHLLTLSAASEEALERLALRFVDHLRTTDDALPDICFTANAGRAHLEYRLALVAPDAEAAATTLSTWVASGEAERLWTGRAGPRSRGACAFLFRYVGSSVPMVEGVEAEVERAALWRSWGIAPALVAGMGAGHLAAARVAGALTADDVARISRDGPERALPAIEVADPIVPLLSSVDGSVVPAGRLREAGFWVDALAGTAVDLQSALREEEVTHVVEIGPDDSGAPLETLASLHVEGLDPDWVAFEGGRARRKVSLPTHPFLRRPFWLDETPPRATAHPPSPWASAHAAALRRSGLAPLDVSVASYPAKWDALARLARAVGRNALVSLGAFPDSNGRAGLDAVMARTGVDALYRPIVARWLDAMVEEGDLEHDGTTWSWVRAPERVELEPLRDSVREVVGDDAPLLRYILHASSLVEGILSGEESPLATLFPEGSFEMASELYEGAGQLRYVNGIAADALESWVAARPPSSPIRVLEIGAGTGGTTSSLLPRLPADRTSYLYTDVSDVFLEWGREKFADVPFVETRRFDLEADPRGQGLEVGSRDVVVASNVLHAARDLPATLRRVRSLLAPGGLLILVESTGHLAWHDITTGMIEGWQHFEDDLRTDGPLLEPAVWLRLFEEAGFADSAAFPPEDSAAGVLCQHVLLARAPDAVNTREAPRAETRAPETPRETVARESAKPEAESELGRRLADAVGSEREEVLVSAVRECVMEVLHSDPDRPPSRDARLMELGVDSLMAVRLGKLLTTRLGLAEPLPSTLIFDYPTIGRIAELVGSRIHASEASSENDTADATPPSTVDDRESELAALSEEEAEALLLRRIEGEESR